MPIERRGNRWEHHTGAYAWIIEKPGVKDGREIRMAEVHVWVPEEHRNKGVATELLRRVVSDLERENETLEAGRRWHSAYVKLAGQFSQTDISRKPYESAGFSVESEGIEVILRRRFWNWK
ncbi:MAG: hypothetical protein J7K68_03670 [Candidatus Diapherotrites archaeon]|nr:hypothetical protein [Candidatus Diapherotrites archaeon]